MLFSLPSPNLIHKRYNLAPSLPPHNASSVAIYTHADARYEVEKSEPPKKTNPENAIPNKGNMRGGRYDAYTPPTQILYMKTGRTEQGRVGKGYTTPHSPNEHILH